MATYTLNPGDDVVGFVAGKANGDIIQLNDGDFRITQAIYLKTNQTLKAVNRRQARINGSVLLPSTVGVTANTQWQTSGSNWKCTGISVSATDSDIYIDDAPALVQVSAEGSVGSGKWYHGGSYVVIGDNPTGKKIEISNATRLISSTGTGINLSGLIIEKCRNGVQQGMLQSDNVTGFWTVTDCEIRYGHGTGVRVTGGAYYANNDIHHHLQICLGGGNGLGGGTQGTGYTFENNRFTYGNYQYLNQPGFEAGGAKWTGSNDFVLRGNYFAHHKGPALWCDINNTGCLVENNTIEDCDWMGIFHEISQKTTIRNNIIRRCATSEDAYNLFWAGIMIAASPDAEIYGNIIEDCPIGIAAFQQNREVYQPEPGHPYYDPAAFAKHVPYPNPVPPGYWDAVYGGYEPGLGRPGVPYLIGGHRIHGLNIHDNIIAHPGGGNFIYAISLGTDVDNSGVFDYSANNRASGGNKYYIGAGSSSAALWNWNGNKTWAQWQALAPIPMDAGGEYHPYSDYNSVTPPSNVDAVNDNFDRADAGTLGSNWTIDEGGWSIVGNRASSTGAGADNVAIYTAATLDPDQFCRLQLVSMGVGDGGPGVRGSAGENGYFIDVRGIGFSATHNIQKVVNHVYTTIPGSEFTATFQVGDYPQIDAYGSGPVTLIARLNMALMVTVVDSVSPITTGQAWMYAYHNDTVIDNFSAGVLTTLGGTVSILRIVANYRQRRVG